MTKRWIAFRIVGCLGALCLLAMGPLGCGRRSHTEAERPESADGARFVSIDAEVFGELERPPVRFDHDRHTAELGAEDCGLCHREDGKNPAIDFEFTFPKNADQTDRGALTDAFHDACIGCHKQRIKERKDAGPVTCGECHVIEPDCSSKEYKPILPDYYEGEQDTHHKDCTACHGDPGKTVEHAAPLDWKSIDVAEVRKIEASWPEVSFDYLLHAKHDEALEGDCQLCHYISPQRRENLKTEGKDPAGRDWVSDHHDKHDLSQRAAAHARCVNCHLNRRANEKEAGPVTCAECHDGTQRTIEELADVDRPECETDYRLLVQLEDGGRAKAVAFNHESHVANSRSCQECHHKTLRPCGDCHGVEGSC